MENQEYIHSELDQLYTNLIITDYKIHKYVEGQLSQEEFETLKVQRQAWRDRINELQGDK